MSDIDKQHLAMVLQLAKPGYKISASLTPEKCRILHSACGLVSEAGELMDAVIKWIFYEKQLDIVNVKEELGDVEFFLQDLYVRLALTRDDAQQGNIDKLAKRYPNFEFSNARAHERADKT